MVTNVTGGARNNHRRFSRQTQQDITGTPAYQSTQRNNSHVNLTRPRIDSTHQRDGKRRKLNQGTGRIEFNFEHAKRDLLNRGQEVTSRTDRKRPFDALTDSHLTPYETSYYGRQNQQSRSRQPSGLNLPSHSSHLRWDANNDDSINDASSTLANSSTSSYDQVQSVFASRRSSLLHGSSIASNPFSPSTFDAPFALPSPSSTHRRWNDGANVPPQIHTDSISPGSNKDSLSIITSSPPSPAFPQNSTTPVGTPPSNRTPQSSTTHQRFSPLATRAEPQSTDARSNVATSNSSKVLSLTTVSSPATTRVAALRDSASNSPAMDRVAALRESSSSSSSTKSIPSSTLPQSAYSFSASFSTQFIKLASSSTSTQKPAFYLVPPQKSEWFGPCCGTPEQRAELSQSFRFNNLSIPQEESEGEEWVSERMGLGCWVLKRDEIDAMERRENEMRMLSLAGLSIDEIDDEEEKGEVRWDEWEWEESDFDHTFEGFEAQSRPRLVLQPPLSHPRPITLTSIDELSEPESKLPLSKITLSNGPWNDPSPSHSRSSSPPALTSSSISQPFTENKAEEEDFPISTKSFLYKSAYEPFPSPSPSEHEEKEEVVEIKLDDKFDSGERALDNLTDEEEGEKNELFDGDDFDDFDDFDEIQDPDDEDWLKRDWGNYSRSNW